MLMSRNEEDLEERKLLGSGGYVFAKLTEQSTRIPLFVPVTDPLLIPFLNICDGGKLD